MTEITHHSLWIVKTDMPARLASIGIQPEDQERIIIKKGEIIEFRYHYGVHFRTTENKYCFVTEEVLLEHCELYGQVFEKTAWENKAKLDEILRLKLYTPIKTRWVTSITLKQHFGFTEHQMRKLRKEAGKAPPMNGKWLYDLDKVQVNHKPKTAIPEHLIRESE